MKELVALLIKSWCWLRIVLSPTLGGVLITILVFSYFGAHIGVYTAYVLLPLGLLCGVLLANRAARRNALVEYSHGLPPPRHGNDK